jgi:hypothetical protein
VSVVPFVSVAANCGILLSTWPLVRMHPSGAMITPEPAPVWSCSLPS